MNSGNLLFIPLTLFVASILYIVAGLPLLDYDNADVETQKMLWQIFIAMLFTTLLSFMGAVALMLFEDEDKYDYRGVKIEQFVLNSDDKISKEFPTFNEYWNSRR